MIKKIIYKMIGKVIAKKLDLQEGKMTDSKKWYKSKGVWTGIVTVLVALYQGIDTQIGPQVGFNLPDIPNFVYAILGAIGIYSRKVATTTIG